MANNPQFKSNPNAIKPGQTVNLGGFDVFGGSLSDTVKKNVGGPTDTTGASKTSTTDTSGSQGSDSSSKTDTGSKINSQQALLYTVADVNSNAVLNGKPPVSFSEALSLAQKDPNIIAKYADAAKIDLSQFNENINQLQVATSIETDKERIQSENDKKALAEANAAAGTAYSGFRGKAEQNLASSEQGIVTSTRSQLQKQLQDATTAFESKYGSNTTTQNINNGTLNTNVNYRNPLTGSSETISPTLTGGLTSSADIAKTADINSQAAYNFGTVAQPDLNK